MPFALINAFYPCTDSAPQSIDFTPAADLLSKLFCLQIYLLYQTPSCSAVTVLGGNTACYLRGESSISLREAYEFAVFGMVIEDKGTNIVTSRINEKLEKH
jgi:hypothetical protein